jgi:iron complex transport system ATP-binding protein
MLNYSLKDVSLCINPGEHWAILGQNGSGKTSLISIINGYHFPSEGKAEVIGQRFGSTDLRELRRSIGECSSEIRNMLHQWESVRDIVLSGRFASIGLYESPTLVDEERARKLMDLFGISLLGGKPFSTLSNGEQQKTIIARALMPEPKLLLLDEPCAGLDPRAREDLLNSVQRMFEQPGGPTLIYITHHIEEIMPAITHALALRQGRVLAKGERKEVLTGKVLSRTFDISIEVQERDGRLWPFISKDHDTSIRNV